MNDANKTKAQLIEKLRALRQRLGKLDQANEVSAVEIAERQRTEALLRENIDRFRLQIEITSDWLWEVDRAGVYTYVSPKVRELLGYEPEEVIGKTPFDLMPADEAERTAAEFRNAVALRKPIERLENVNLHKDGHRVVLETSAVPVLDADGEFLGYRGIDRDITVRKRAEEALRTSEQRYRTIVEDQTELICRWLPGGIHTFVNEAYCRCFGKSSAELIGHNLLELIPTEEHDQVQKHFAFLCRENPVAIHEHRVIARDGALRWHQWTDRAIFDQHGNVIEYQSVGRDITERRRAEEALRRSEERFRTLFENTPIGFYRTTPDGRIDEANPALVKMLGFSSFEELAQRNLEDGGFEPEYARSEFRRRVEREGTVTLEETAWKKRDGSVLYIRENAKAIRAADGQVKCYEGTVEDVTQRRQAEQALRQSEELFRTVVDASQDAMITIDRAGLITIFNRAAERMFGHANQTMIGQPLDCLMPEEYRDRHRKYVNSFFATGTPNKAIGTTLELPALRNDGTVFPIELSLSASERDDQQFVLAVIRDITDRKRAEEVLRTERDHSARIISGTPAIVCGIAPDGATTSVNPAGEQITGYAAEELVGRNWWRVLYPGDEYRQVEQLFQDFKQGGVRDYEMVLTTRAGEKRTISWNSINRFDESDRLVEIIGFGNDVTERKRAAQERTRLAEQLQQAQKMQTVGQVAASIAHEFGNLLAVARNGVKQLQESPPAGNEMRETLDVIEQAVEEATSTTQSLLMFSRKLPTERIPLEMGQFVEEVAQILRHLLPSSIELCVRACDDQVCWVNADPGQLQQVLLNLTLNARDAMPTGGTLTISVTPADGVRLVVADSGTGIPIDLHECIFEPFFSTKLGGHGTGLGLATVKSIVQDHGGRIELESQVDRGSTFTVILPSVSPTPAAPMAVPVAPLGRGEVVVLAEANRHIRRLVTAMLRSWNYQVLTPPEGSTCYDVFMQDPDRVALLIMKADPPEHSGLDCLRKIRAAGYQTPIVLTAATFDMEIEQECDAATILLRKPFQMTELGTHLSELLAKRGATRE